MLTSRQHQALGFIRNYINNHGYAPTLTEIATGLGIRSRGVAHRYVQALADAGSITLVPGRQRGIQLEQDEADTGATLPLAGRIAAGCPIEAIPEQQTLNLAGLFVGPNRYALHVQGDSMVEAGILNGDTVIVRQSDSADEGDIIVALIDHEEATLKRLHYRHDGSVALVAAHPTLPPMIYSPERVKIQGVVVGQLRTYI